MHQRERSTDTNTHRVCAVDVGDAALAQQQRNGLAVPGVRAHVQQIALRLHGRHTAVNRRTRGLMKLSCYYNCVDVGEQVRLGVARVLQKDHVAHRGRVLDVGRRQLGL